MTQEDQDAVIGKTVRQLRDISQRLAALKAKAREMADAFLTVGYNLNNQPELLSLLGEGVDPRFAKPSRPGYRQEDKTPKRELLEIADVLSLRDEIKQALLEEDRLKKSLSDMGYRNIGE